MLAGWLNENSYRSYPFQSGADVPQDAVSDMGVLIGPFLDQSGFSNSNLLSDYSPVTKNVQLSQIALVSGNVEYTFTLPGTFVTVPLVFVCPASAPPLTTYFANAYQGSKLIWQGFLVTGYLVDTLAALGLSSVITYSSTFLEEACIQDLSNRFVASINLANFPRSTVDAPAGCPGNTAGDPIPKGTAPTPDSTVIITGNTVSINGELLTQAVVNATNITGSVVFREGYNCAMRQEAGTNSLVISGANNAGAGPVCGEVPIDATEAAILESNTGQTLTGGPTCQQLLLSLNGVAGQNIVISGGDGFKVTPSTIDQHTLIISAVTGAFTACTN